MNRRERLLVELIKCVSRINTVSDSSDVLSGNSCYITSIENNESHILNGKSIREMNLLIERAVGDDSAAKCLTALTFLDLYTCENVKQDKSLKKQESESIEVPAYTYTL